MQGSEYKSEMMAYFRKSHWSWSIEKDVLKNVVNFTGKNLCRSLFFNKVAGLRPAALLKMRLRHRCFYSGFCEIFKNTLFIKHNRAAASVICSSRDCYHGVISRRNAHVKLKYMFDMKKCPFHAIIKKRAPMKLLNK